MFEQAQRLNGRVAFVAGAGKGLGRAIAEALAEAGADVVGVSRTAADVEALSREVKQRGCRGLALTADLVTSAAVDAAVQRAIDDMGKIDILVNAVGGNLHKPLIETTDEDWERSLRANLSSTFYTCRAVAPHMLKQRAGCVINIASTAGLRGRPNISSYCATKAAVINFSRALAVEWASSGIRVNVLCPGRFRTPATAPEMDDPVKFSEFVKRVPLGRIGDPDEIKSAAVFLASPASAFATGMVLVLDGGQTIV